MLVTDCKCELPTLGILVSVALTAGNRDRVAVEQIEEALMILGGETGVHRPSRLVCGPHRGSPAAMAIGTTALRPSGASGTRSLGRVEVLLHPTDGMGRSCWSTRYATASASTDSDGKARGYPRIISRLVCLPTARYTGRGPRRRHVASCSRRTYHPQLGRHKHRCHQRGCRSPVAAWSVRLAWYPWALPRMH